MQQPGGEKIRSFLVNWVFTSICGMTLSQWACVLRQQRFNIDLPYWPRAAFVTGASLITTLFRGYEDLVYLPKIKDVVIKSPLFILGHRRSGTTHLLNLLAMDQQFAYPNVFQALNPHTFLTTERFSKYVRVLSPRTRIIDNMKLGFEVPFEDEFATCNATLHSPYLSWAFPQSARYYDRYLTFRDVPDEEIKRWQAGLVLFLKKLTWKYDRPLLLKSPPHTCRIKVLLELFPEARFVHIHRNPYHVFQSAQRQTMIMSRATRLQNANGEDIAGRIIKGYKEMYDVFFEERALIPASQFHEMCFEALEKDRVGQIRQLYEALDLPGFETMRPSLQRYVDSLAGYQKNEYAELPAALRSEIVQAWERSFEEWGYGGA